MSREGTRSLVGGEARGVKNLHRADFAKPEIGREPRGRGFVGTVTLVGIAANPVEEVGQPLARCGLAGRPAFAHPAGPVGFGGLEPPVIQPVGFDFGRRRQRLWCGLGTARIAEREHALPERCEDTQWPAIVGEDLARFDQQVAGEGAAGQSVRLQRRDHCVIGRHAGPIGAAVPVDLGGAGVTGNQWDHIRSLAASQHQPLAALAQIAIEGSQGLRQPPARRAAMCT